MALYDRDRDRWAFYADSYWGGLHYRAPSSTVIGKASIYNRVAVPNDSDGDGPTDLIVDKLAKQYPSYLVPHSGERPVEFERRMSLAACVNVCAPIIDAYADSVTGRVRRELGVLEPYLGNLDGKGRDWSSLVEEVARWSCDYGWFATVVDSRRTGEEDGTPDDLRVLMVHPPAIAWIDVNDDGQVEEFAFADQPFSGAGVTASTQSVRLWVWTRTMWEVRGGEVSTSKGLAEQRGAFRPMRDKETGEPISGKLPSSLRGRCPVTFCYYREVTSSRWPTGVSLIEDAADLQRQIFNELSCIEEIHRKTAFPFLAIPTKARGNALAPETKLQIGPDTALPFSNDTGTPQWIQPSPATTAELREHCLFLFQLALRTCGLEVMADESAQVSSGAALQIRSRDFDARAVKFARVMRRWERQTLDMVAAYLDVSNDASITYPTRFVLPDPQEELARAVLLLQTVEQWVGDDGMAALLRQAISAGTTLADEDVDALVKEIRQGFTDARAAKAPAATPDAGKPAEPAVVDEQAVAPDTALNGAQVESLLAIVDKVAARGIPREVGVAMIAAAFPLSSQEADALLGEVGTSFFVEAPAPPAKVLPFARKPVEPADAEDKPEDAAMDGKPTMADDEGEAT